MFHYTNRKFKRPPPMIPAVIKLLLLSISGMAFVAFVGLGILKLLILISIWWK